MLSEDDIGTGPGRGTKLRAKVVDAGWVACSIDDVEAFGLGIA
jgi:hypothetical protein